MAAAWIKTALSSRLTMKPRATENGSRMAATRGASSELKMATKATMTKAPCGPSRWMPGSIHAATYREMAEMIQCATTCATVYFGFTGSQVGCSP